MALFVKDREAFIELLVDTFDEDNTPVETINEWLGRGDGVAVYENCELGSPDAGARKFVSYGGPEAQLETFAPPVRLPDIGTQINWRFNLVATYRGEAL